jgi:virulence factor
MTGFNRRFVPLLQRCKELVEAAGPIHLAVASFHKHDHDPDDFGFHRGAVSHLTSDVIHAVDALRWIAGGNVKEVAAHARSVGRPYPNSYAAIIDFDTGCSGILLASRRSGTRHHHFEFHGGDVAVYSDDQHRAELFTGESATPTVLLGRDLARSMADHHLFGFFGENRHFIESIQNSIEPVTNFADAVKTMRLAEQISNQRR